MLSRLRLTPQRVTLNFQPLKPLRYSTATRPTPITNTKINAVRPTQVRAKPLPNPPNTLPYLIAFISTALLSWSAFTIYATNNEKLSSSIFKSILTQIKSSPQIPPLLSPDNSVIADGLDDGEGVVLKREIWLGGMCKVNGSVNMMQGRVDLSFKIHPKGEEGRTGTVYFTSVRESKRGKFEVLRFLVVNDETGERVSLLEEGAKSIDAVSGDIV